MSLQPQNQPCENRHNTDHWQTADAYLVNRPNESGEQSSSGGNVCKRTQGKAGEASYGSHTVDSKFTKGGNKHAGEILQNR
jgi:hypothetical protein